MSTMSFQARHLVPAPRTQVWQWHTRPGAVTRLTPPFLPMVPLQQTDSLATGTTILGFPGGLRWTAQHQLDGYEEFRRFTDVCINAPVRQFAHWRHEHRFEDSPVRDTAVNSGGPTTIVTDTVDSRLPGSALTPMFAYRQHQLRQDFLFLQRLADAVPGYATQDVSGDLTSRDVTTPTRPLTVAMTGSRGAVGRALTAQLTTAGHKVVQLVRGKAKSHQRSWEPLNPHPDLLRDVDVVVHLAGEPIFGRFNDNHKNAIRESRVEPTRKLAELVANTPGVQALVSASAIGYYGNERGDEKLTEASEPGDGFLAQVTQDWEAATAPAAESGTRVVLIRTGVALDGGHGLLPLLRTLFSTGLGGRFGDGQFWFSWISADDLTDIYFRTIVDAAVSGPINATSPHPLFNEDFAQALGRELKRPTLIPIPTVGPALLLGKEGARELALAEQRVIPAALDSLGHAFRYPAVDAALAHELGGEPLTEA